MPFFGASTTTLLQEIVEPDLQGRVFGVQGLIMNTVMPLGMLVFGPLADIIPIETLLIVSSGLMAIPGIWIFFHRQLPPSVPAATPVEHEWLRTASQQPGD
jgi:DHA3 family macrolide efflux protein-like MFS transporter